MFFSTIIGSLADMSGCAWYMSVYGLTSTAPIVTCLLHAVRGRFPRALYYAGRRWHWTIMAAFPTVMRHLLLKVIELMILS